MLCGAFSSFRTHQNIYIDVERTGRRAETRPPRVKVWKRPLVGGAANPVVLVAERFEVDRESEGGVVECPRANCLDEVELVHPPHPGDATESPDQRP